jgi:hypothetical protein
MFISILILHVSQSVAMSKERQVVESSIATINYLCYNSPLYQYLTDDDVCTLMYSSKGFASFFTKKRHELLNTFDTKIIPKYPELKKNTFIFPWFAYPDCYFVGEHRYWPSKHSYYVSTMKRYKLGKDNILEPFEIVVPYESYDDIIGDDKKSIACSLVSSQDSDSTKIRLFGGNGEVTDIEKPLNHQNLFVCSSKTHYDTDHKSFVIRYSKVQKLIKSSIGEEHWGSAYKPYIDLIIQVNKSGYIKTCKNYKTDVLGGITDLKDLDYLPVLRKFLTKNGTRTEIKRCYNSETEWAEVDECLSMPLNNMTWPVSIKKIIDENLPNYDRITEQLTQILDDRTQKYIQESRLARISYDYWYYPKKQCTDGLQSLYTKTRNSLALFMAFLCRFL